MGGFIIAKNIDWTFVYILLFFALFFFLQAYVNLVKKRISRFGLDALVISITLSFSKRKQREIVKKGMKDPKHIRKIGVDALLLAIGGIWGSIYYILHYIYRK
jgi:hypothetical protein